MPNTPTILIAEDNEMDVMLLRQALKTAGFNNPVHVVRDGEEAIHYLAGHGTYSNRHEFPLPGLVFLDLGLPRRSGFEVLKWIGGAHRVPSFEVVILSGSTAPEDMEIAHRLGAREFISKPDTLDELVAEVKSLEEFLEPGHLHFPSIVQRGSTPASKATSASKTDKARRTAVKDKSRSLAE